MEENSNNVDKKTNSDIELLRELVEDLYHLRDYYFETHTIYEASQKPVDVAEKLKNILAVFETKEESALAEDRAEYYYLLGKAFNVHEKYSLRAEEMLKKAVKLNPNLIDAWNNLGECLYKNKQPQEARTCFENALSKKPNKDSLRCLSIAMRHQLTNSCTHEELISNRQEGIKYAVQAVQMDVTDGLSWAALGNAYLCMFFCGMNSHTNLHLAVDAYKRAQMSIVADYSADLHYNRALVFQYQQDYKESLITATKAMLLDPQWESPARYKTLLLKYLQQTQELYSEKGRMKPKKRLQNLLNIMDKKNLIPAPLLQTYEPLPVSKLKTGKNEDKILVGVVVCSIFNELEVPFTFCLVDKENTCIVVTVYNLAAGKGVIIGDYVAIQEPYISNIHFDYEEKVYKFQNIRVDMPTDMIINGKPISREYISVARIYNSIP